LADRGQKASAIMKDFFGATNKNFDIVLSSTALRAVETIEIIKPSIKDTKIIYKKELYTFDDQIMIEFISKINDDISSLLIVGHNPAIQETVLRLARTDQNANLLNRVEHKYPTAAFCTLTSTIEKWAHTGDTLFKLQEFICPKEL
tara:strand:+ start:255 stop:692 length:438 start_codon:yes stop_codon:yes gene_type:complete